MNRCYNILHDDIRGELMIKGIIFDLDGVLIDSEQIHFQAYSEMLKFYDIDLSREQFDTLIRSKGKKVGLKSLLGQHEFLIEMGILKDKIFIDILNDLPEIFYEDALELLKLLMDRNLKLAVATASGKGKELIDIYGKKDNFDIIATPEDVLNNKPSPDIYEYCLNQLGLECDEVIVIEDSQVGIQSASNANLKVLGIRCGDIPGITVIDDLREVLDYI